MSEAWRYNGATWLRIESPAERLDRLVLSRTLRVTDNGFGIWCHSCKQVICSRPFEPTHEWFEELTWGLEGSANEHFAECWQKP